MANLINPAGTSAKISNFITRAVNKSNALLDAQKELNDMYKEAVILGYASSVTDADFVGDNNHIDKAALVALFGSIAAVEALMVANSNTHYKNFYAMKRG
jgi:hypothetical protein